MNGFEQIGAAMLLAEQGKQDLARQAAKWLAACLTRLADWLHGNVKPSSIG